MFKIKATKEEIQAAEAFMNKIPLSFTYNGQPFPKGFSGDRGIYNSCDGKLKCEFPFTVYEDSSAVEWLPVFTGVGEGETCQIKNVMALDTVFETDGEPELFYAKGALSSIDDFSLQSTKLTSEPFVLKGPGSRYNLPFFNLRTGSGGVIIGLGFTGSWYAEFTVVSGGVRVRVYIGETDFHLLSGESVRNILMLTIFWRGDLQRSFNMLRNHLTLYYIPKDENGEPNPPICCNSWGSMKTDNHLKYIKFIKDNDLKFDIYWMDAGWHSPDHETEEFQNLKYEDWYYHQGEWLPNKCVHPNGLLPISQAAREAGMGLLLWFGAYVCNHGIGWHKDHPEWASDNNTKPHGIGANRTRMTITHYIDMENPEARKWLGERIGSTMKDNGVIGYREDCCISPVIEEEGRIGIKAMKSVEHLYEFWDDLRSKVPGLIIDNCGGGGSRIDLETLKRSYVLWRSDYNCHPSADPIGAQVGNYGLGHFIPLINGAPPSNPGSTYNFHSGLYGGMSFGLFHPVGVDEPEKHTWFGEDYPVEWHKRMLEHYRLAKPYLSGSFYPLTECTLSSEDALSYQFDRPDMDGGIIFCFFRPLYQGDSLTIKPVLEKGNYLFTNAESGESFCRQWITDDELTVRADTKPMSVLLHYKKIN